jgi:proteasome lid subunit RPN8/RPN11
MNTSHIEAEIRFQSRRNTAEERCGVIVMQTKGLRVIDIPNIAIDKAHAFELEHGLYLYHLRMGNLWGIWHSHPRGEGGFSQPDISVGDAVGLHQILYELEPNRFTYRTPPTHKPAPLLGRIFCFGTQDCWSFMQDFERHFYNIAIDDFDPALLTRIGTLRDPTESAYYWERNGFRPVYQPRTGRIVTLSIRARGLVNHVGVLARNDLIGHHLIGQRSSVEQFNTDFWRMSVVGFLTHDVIEADNREELILS